MWDKGSDLASWIDRWAGHQPDALAIEFELLCIAVVMVSLGLPLTPRSYPKTEGSSQFVWRRPLFLETLVTAVAKTM